MSFVIENGKLDSYEGNEERIVVPEGVTHISQFSFSKNNHLCEVVLPEGLLSIGNFSFTFSKNLRKINVPSTVTSIGLQALEGTSLERIFIPKSVATIADNAFNSCSSLEEFEVDIDHPTLKSIDGCIYSKDGKALIKCAGAKESYSFPEGVTKIGVNAFQGCTKLKSLDIPDCISEIGDKAFEKCTSLEKISLPNGLETIKHDLFPYCTSLEEINLPSTVNEILGGAFMGCTSLKSIILPKNIKKLWYYTFCSCRCLKSVVLPEALELIDGSSVFEGCTNLDEIYVTSISSFSALNADMKKKASFTFIENLDSFPFSKEVSDRFKKYIKSQYKKVIPYKLSDVAYVSYITREGILPFEEIDDLVERASNSEVLAILLDYKNKTATPDKLKATQKRDFDLDAPSSIGLTEEKARKLWDFVLKDDGTLELILYKRKGGTVELPEMIEGKAVTSIARDTFKNSKDIKKLIIPSTYPSVSASLFPACYKIREYVILGMETDVSSFWLSTFSAPVIFFVHKGSLAEAYAKKREYTIKYIE